MSDFDKYLAADARLCILKELARHGTLNEALITRVLDVHGHRRSREWVRTQMRKLADIGAVNLADIGAVEAGAILIASISRAGLDHVEGRAFLDGVARPSPEA